MTKILCIDMDSVIVDLMSEWFRLYNSHFNDSITVNEAISWDATKYVKEECGYRIYEFLKEEGFYSKLKPIPGSINAIHNLSKTYEIMIVTSPPSKYAYKEKEEWLLKYLDIIPRENLIFTHRKELIRGDLLFDDSPVNLLNFSKNGGISVAMDYPYNKCVECQRVSTWGEFECKIEELLKNH